MSMETMSDTIKRPKLVRTPLRAGASGERVRLLSRDLAVLGHLPAGSAQGLYDRAVEAAVRRFQVAGIGADGLPLAVDGVAGQQTLFGIDLALGRELEAPNNCISPPHLGETASVAEHAGLKALRAALAEIEDGAQEIGGVGRGPYCRRYLAAAGVREGRAWATAFTSWCLGETGVPDALRLMDRARVRGWTMGPFPPKPGDVMVWTSELGDGFGGHAGLVVWTDNGRVHTIEAGRTPFVEFFHHDWTALAPLVTVIRPEATTGRR